MIKALRKRSEVFLATYWPLLTIVFVFLILRIVTLQSDAIPSWDASVYVGMGKYLYSHGAIGTWEALRPVGLPIILGAFWKIGFDPYAVGTVLSLAVSSALLVLTYVFAEHLRSGSGAIAATLLAGASVFFSFSAIPVTDITSVFLSLLALFLIFKANVNRKYFIGGIVIALAFMFRFPQGLMLVVSMLVILIKLFYEKGKPGAKTERLIERAFTIAGGFFLIVVPYIVCNYVFYDNAFLPFIEGTAVIKLYPSLYQKGPWFYLLEAFKQNPAFVFALVPIGLLWNRKQRSVAVFSVISALLVVSAYFTLEAHKETRYMLAFLPYIVLLSAVGIAYVLDYFKLPQLLFFGLFAIVGFMLHAGLLVHPYRNPDNAVVRQFESYLNRAPAGSRVISTTPNLFVYSDVFLVRNLYSDWNDAYAAYGRLHGDTDYMLLNSCNLETGCTDNAHCKDDKQILLSTLAQKDTEVFSATTASQCMLSIYKLAH